MDILLTHGYFLSEDAVEKRVMRPYPPLGLLYLSAYLKSKGFTVKVLDTTFRTRQEVFAQLARERPGCVGIYGNLLTRQNVLELISVCKGVGATVILGGPEPANYAEEYLTHGADVVVMGEGELTLERLLVHLQQNGAEQLQAVEGVVFRGEDGRVVRTPPRALHPDLDALPFPDRDAIDLRAYLEAWRTHHGSSSVSLICARGCPYTCTWCSHSVFGFSHRRRSPANVAEEVTQIVAQFSPDRLWYADDVFTLHHGWLFEYADELRRRNLRLPFECISREDRLNEAVVAELAEMGCFRLWIGSESGSQRVLDAMQRRTDAERVRYVTRLLQQHGVEVGMFIMLGYEGETERDLEATLEHLKAAKPNAFLTTVAYPIKGTEYYQKVADRIVRKGEWAKSTERDLDVAGRPSRRYYAFANRWLVNEVALHRRAHNGRLAWLRRTKAFVNARVGRLGMHLLRPRHS